MNKMKNLLELFNQEIIDFPNINKGNFLKVEKFITSDSECAQFINNLLFDEPKPIYPNKSLQITNGRARHSVISFLLGLCIKNFCGLFGKFSSALNDDNPLYLEFGEPYIDYWLWLITATNHDYGYFSKYLNTDTCLSELEVKYNLFDDKSYFKMIYLKDFEKKYVGILKNNYAQINDYFEFSKFYHLKHGDNEKCDHGILGAYLLFDKLVKSVDNFSIKKIDYSLSFMNRNKSLKDILLYKSACLTIAQHNIYKSLDSKDDVDYLKYNLAHLTSNSNYYLDIDTPILTLLSLVDTLECIKAFSRAENKKNYIQTVTILKNIKMAVSKHEILVDYNDLFEEVNKRNDKNIQRIFDSYIESIKCLNFWTKFIVEEKTPNIIKITRKS